MFLASHGLGQYIRAHFLDKTFQGLYQVNTFDLLLLIPFDIARFRQDVRRNRPDAPMFELSSLSGRGMNLWLNWLVRHLKKPHRYGDDVSQWFG